MNQKNITKTLNYIQKNDLVSLKAAYQDIFQKVIVQPLDESKVQLEFVFKEDPLSPRTFEDFYCISAGVAYPARFERATTRFVVWNSIQLSHGYIIFYILYLTLGIITQISII